MTAEHMLAQSRERIVTDMKGFIGDAEELLRAVAGASGEAIAGARHRFEEKLTRVKQLVNEGEEAARQTYNKAVDTTDRYVHESPWQAIGIGFAAGVLIGYLSHRRQ